MMCLHSDGKIQSHLIFTVLSSPVADYFEGNSRPKSTINVLCDFSCLPAGRIEMGKLDLLLASGVLISILRPGGRAHTEKSNEHSGQSVPLSLTALEGPEIRYKLKTEETMGI